MNKYKIFDTERNEYAKDGDWSIDSQSGIVRGIYGEEFSQMKPLQFTGISDKNGIEIYADDIVSDGNLTFTVVWNTQNGAWKLDPLYSNVDLAVDGWLTLVLEYQSLGNGYFKRDDLEVIGNINFKK